MALRAGGRIVSEQRGDPYIEVLAEEWGDGVIVLDGEVERVTIGRADDNDVCLQWDNEVSRTHAVLERLNEVWTIIDDGLSLNGTFVNGQRVEGRRRLEHADNIRLGATLLLFHGAPNELSVTAAATSMESIELTPAQRAVLKALCRPFADGDQFAVPASNQQIADELTLSVETVRSHLRVLFSVLQVSDVEQNRKRVVAAQRAFESGLVSRRELRSPD